MSELLCDFSWGRPGAAGIKEAGYSGVIRYLSDDTTGKNLTAPERDEYFAAGLSIRLVYENGAQAALGGSAQGLIDGRDALKQAQALGLPKGYGIYYAIDFDATAAQMASVESYGAGFALGLAGYYQCARYGGYNTINGQGTSWQTCAWSGGKVSKNANIYQNGEQAFGGSADVDELLIDDGWGWRSTDASTPAVASPTPAVAKGPGGTYTVKSGDTLSGIGAKLGVDWRAIAQLNNIGAPFTIYPNEVLHLPGGAVEPSSGTIRYTVKFGDNLSDIADHFGVDYHTIAKLNGIADPNKIYTDEVLLIPSGSAPVSNHATYTVREGDTLSGIGAKEGINWQAVASLNGISAPYVIFPGEVLRLS